MTNFDPQDPAQLTGKALSLLEDYDRSLPPAQDRTRPLDKAGGRIEGP